MLPITHETELKHFALGFGANPLRRTGWRGPSVWAGWTWLPPARPCAKLGDTSLEIPCAWPCAALPRPHLQDFTPWKCRNFCSGAGDKAGNQLLVETHLNTGGRVAFTHLCKCIWYAPNFFWSSASRCHPDFVSVSRTGMKGKSSDVTGDYHPSSLQPELVTDALLLSML